MLAQSELLCLFLSIEFPSNIFAHLNFLSKNVTYAYKIKEAD